MQQNSHPRPYARSRRIFGWIFAVSTVVFLLLAILRLQTPPVPPEPDPDVLYSVEYKPPYALYISLFASVTSFLGFVTNTVFMVRKERRDTEHADLASQRQQLEIEKLRRELNKQTAPKGGRADDENAEPHAQSDT